MQGSVPNNSIADIIIPICFISFALAVHFRLLSLRLKSVQNLAGKYHLMQISNDLPGDFPMNRIDGIGSFNQVSNAFCGPNNGNMLLVFDIQIGFGRQSYTRTIVGRRFLNLPAEPKLKSSLRYQQVGQWRVVHARRSIINPSARLSPALIEQLWNLLAGPEQSPLDPSAVTSPPHPTEILIRPRKR